VGGSTFLPGAQQLPAQPAPQRKGKDQAKRQHKAQKKPPESAHKKSPLCTEYAKGEKVFTQSAVRPKLSAPGRF